MRDRILDKENETVAYFVSSYPVLLLVCLHVHVLLLALLLPIFTLPTYLRMRILHRAASIAAVGAVTLLLLLCQVSSKNAKHGP